MKNQNRGFPDSTVITATLSSAVEAGDVVVIGGQFAVAMNKTAANVANTFITQGEFRLPKATGSSTAIAFGARVTWDATNKRVATWARAAAGSTSLPIIGTCTLAAVDGDAEVVVRIEPQILRYVCMVADAAVATANVADLDIGLGAVAPVAIVSAQIEAASGGLRRNVTALIGSGASTNGGAGKVRVGETDILANEICHLLVQV